MSRQRSHDESGRPRVPPRVDAGADHPADEPARPGEHGGDVRRERLDTIEWADDRTRSLDPHQGGMDEDPIEDLIEGSETDASYRSDATHATPTLDPDGAGEGER